MTSKYYQALRKSALSPGARLTSLVILALAGRLALLWLFASH